MLDFQNLRKLDIVRQESAIIKQPTHTNMI